MGVTCFDSEPEKWLGYQRRRDEFLQADDRFMWNIDTYNLSNAGMLTGLRFRWIMRPGNDFYVVYTHNWVDDPLQNRIYTLDRRAASKVLYTHRF